MLWFKMRSACQAHVKKAAFLKKSGAKNFWAFGPGAFSRQRPHTKLTKVFCAAFFQKSCFFPDFTMSADPKNMFVYCHWRKNANGRVNPAMT
jgi:hypothetical protein